LELAGIVGLPEGRYLVREGGRERVLVVQELGAPRPQPRRRRRARPVEAKDPEAVPVTRLTVTGERLDDASAGSQWIEATVRDPKRFAAEVREATEIVNRAIAAFRAASGDALIQDIGASKALAVRVGHGSGQQLADGEWTEAREMPRPGREHHEDVQPQSRVAAVLGGRDEVHPAETLMLRALLDAEQGRYAEATYGLRAAREAMSENPPTDSVVRKRLEKNEERVLKRLDEPST
jgi:hypothetical protein